MTTPLPGDRDPAAGRGCVVTVEAVMFDLDGVLVDSTRSVERLWRGFAADHDLDADELLRDLHGRRMMDIMAAAVPHLDRDQLAIESTRFDAAEAADAHRTDALPGAHELTRQLTDDGVPWAVVTSGTAAVAAARIAAVGLAAPPALVTADEVRAGKPDPEPYLAAAQRLQVDPARCLVVEDAPSGLTAGNRAGATTVAVATSHPPTDLGHAHHHIRTVDDLALVQRGSGDVTVALACSQHAGSVGRAGRRPEHRRG